MLPLPLAVIGFNNFIVLKFALNVLSETVFPAAELTLGTIATRIPPTNATQARDLPILAFKFPPFKGESYHVVPQFETEKSDGTSRTTALFE